MARAVPTRRAEFAAGRAAARTAMSMLEWPQASVPKGPDRAPLWPAGLTGSITHDGALALAALAPAGTIRGIGIDAEHAAPLPPDIAGTALSDAERKAVAAAGPLAGRMVFSVKEAAYKCLYPMTGEILGFDAMQVVLDLRGDTATARLTRATGPFPAGHTLCARIAQAEGRILVAVILEPEAN